MDPLRLAVIVSFLAGAILIASALFIASQNAGSKNLPLAFAAVTGVILGFFIQLKFELVSSTKTEMISTEFTVDRGAPLIRQWAYDPGKALLRIGVETGAGEWIAKNNVAAFDERRK